MTTWGYMAVSTTAQDADAQQLALRVAGVDAAHVVIDHVSGRRAPRPGLDRLLAGLDEGDVLTVWKMNRFGRSDAALVDLVDGLRRRGVEVHSVQGGLDTTTALGRLVFRFLAASRGRT